jgi:hypothetical protein
LIGEDELRKGGVEEERREMCFWKRRFKGFQTRRWIYKLWTSSTKVEARVYTTCPLESFGVEGWLVT